MTVSERRVSEVTAEGSSNPVIAQTLFVLRVTVETHVGSVRREPAVPGSRRDGGRSVSALPRPTDEAGRRGESAGS